MRHSTLTPVFTGLRLGLHVLLVGLTSFAVASAYVASSPVATISLVMGIAFLGVYLAGAWVARTAAERGVERRGVVIGWVIALTALWAALMWLRPEGAYLVFPLFFLYLHVLPGAGGGAAVIVATILAIGGLALHLGFSVGGVIGPAIGAGVALLIGLAYRALNQEANEREQLVTELVRTRQQLAETEREQGALAERARLAREIHDTVAQGLSSIQMLLRAAERDAASGSAGADYVRLARETAAESLAETRQIIRELTPSRLEDGLAPALRRLGQEQASRAAVRLEVEAEEVDLPMGVQTALLRIAQGAIANAVSHASATLIVVALTGPHDTVARGPVGSPSAASAGRADGSNNPVYAGRPDDSAGSVVLVVRDDGRGFDVSSALADSHSLHSFGIQAMQERVDQLDGTLEITSAPGHGTTVTVRLPVVAQSEARPQRGGRS